MAVKRWDATETTEVNGVIYQVGHQEFTVKETSEIEDIDTNFCLQGSIVLDISTGKMSVWDGESWVEQ